MIRSLFQLSVPLTATEMILAIVIALIAVVAVELTSRRLRSSPSKPYLTRAMVGVPEVHMLKAASREGAIREMVSVASRIIRAPSEEVMLKGVLRREGQMATGLVHGIAVPHSRFANLDRSLVLFGRSSIGIEWECFDGEPARYIFLILSPEDDEHAQLQMLAEIGRCADTPSCIEVLATASDCRAVTRAIEHVHKVRSSREQRLDD